MRERRQQGRFINPDYSPLLPAAPLGERLSEVRETRNQLARRYTWEYGGSPLAARRQLIRLIYGRQRYVRVDTVDRWAMLLNESLATLYPEGAAWPR